MWTNLRQLYDFLRPTTCNKIMEKSALFISFMTLFLLLMPDTKNYVKKIIVIEWKYAVSQITSQNLNLWKSESNFSFCFKLRWRVLHMHSWTKNKVFFVVTLKEHEKFLLNCNNTVIWLLEKISIWGLREF